MNEKALLVTLNVGNFDLLAAKCDERPDKDEQAVDNPMDFQRILNS